LKGVAGTVHVIDEQLISLSNLQRYILTTESDEGRIKVELGAQHFEESIIKVEPYPRDWKNYCAHLNHQIPEVIITALDSANDRITVQAALPKTILNGFTEEGLLGVSRHWNFLGEACLACMYLPSRPKLSRAMEVAQNLGIVNSERTVREYLYYNRDVDASLLKLISDANGIPMEQLSNFVGTPMSEFYSNFVCGGIFLKLKGDSKVEQKIEAPLAFQSAFAGILLASELFLWRAGYRKEAFANVTHFYPLLAINSTSNPYHHSLAKDVTGRCLCSDADFRSVYQTKWSAKDHAPVSIQSL
jgi:molybdopterin/thiamine biosynthesis adenylyltransferase